MAHSWDLNTEQKDSLISTEELMQAQVCLTKFIIQALILLSLNSRMTLLPRREVKTW
jgi:hypothetical protein